MKWIGQHIYDLVARFRDDVYLEDISSGTIASGGNLGLDSNNKIVKQSDTGITDLHGAGVDGSNNQLLTDDGDGTITSEANLTFDGSTLSIEADANTTANALFIDANALTTGSVISIDVDDAGVNATKSLVDIDFLKGTAMGLGASNITTGLNINMADTSTNSGGSAVKMIGAQIDIDSANAQGNITQKGLVLNVAADGVADAATTSGIEMEVADGGTDILMTSSDNTTVDTCAIAVGASGATTITTVDGGGAAADLTLTVDGDIVLSPAGKVGIGTAAPEDNLHVAGADDADASLLVTSYDTDTAANYPTLRLFRARGTQASPSIIADGDYLGGVDFGGWLGSTGGDFYTNYDVGASITAIVDGAPSNANEDIPTALTFFTNGETTKQGERMRITPDGKVGVGTTSPDALLEVSGKFAANGINSTFATMTSGDTSPPVHQGNIFKTHSDGVTIDQFDGGTCGQIITIISGGATVYDVTTSELKGGTTNITTAAGDVTVWVCESATVWHLISWMDLSADLSSGGF